MRSGRVSEADALAYLAKKWGDAGQARKAYLEGAREGRLDVYSRRGLMSPNRELTPREDWFRCDWYELPDPLSTGFHLVGRLGWHDREVRWDQLETLVPRSRPLGRPPRDTDRIVAAIRGAIKEGKIASEELPTVKDTVLENLVGGSRHTRREARKIVLDETKNCRK
jgi:hypothetical protein